jgi:hypothetical protein
MIKSGQVPVLTSPLDRDGALGTGVCSASGFLLHPRGNLQDVNGGIAEVIHDIQPWYLREADGMALTHIVVDSNSHGDVSFSECRDAVTALPSVGQACSELAG